MRNQRANPQTGNGTTSPYSRHSSSKKNNRSDLSNMRIQLRSALADFLDRLRSAKKCASKTLLPDFLMPANKRRQSRGMPKAGLQSRRSAAILKWLALAWLARVPLHKGEGLPRVWTYVTIAPEPRATPVVSGVQLFFDTLLTVF